ncbi:MAG: 6-phosphofructokinase, partial [Candidatus Omnitrophica bacterium]|nr:6-phosphofructokinase [Candidatus Omnitrophota bacterium]
MKTLFYKNSFFINTIGFIIAVNFMLIGIPKVASAEVSTADMLRATATKDDGGLTNQITNDLKAAKGQTTQKPIKLERVGILCSGGTADGHNAAIYAAVKRILEMGKVPVIIWEGWDGLYNDDLVAKSRPFTFEEAKARHYKGGTWIGTDRMNPYAQNKDGSLKIKDAPTKIIGNIRKLNLDGLMVLGGNNSHETSYKLKQEFPELYIVGLAKTMDNDLALKQLLAMTYGTRSFVSNAVRQLVSFLRDATSMRRIGVAEIYGRNAGHVAVLAGARIRADLTLIPEQGQIDLAQVIEDTRRVWAERKSMPPEKFRAPLIVVSEGIIINKNYRNNSEILDKAFAKDSKAKFIFESANNPDNLDPYGNPKLEGAKEVLKAVLNAYGLNNVELAELKNTVRSAGPVQGDIADCEIMAVGAVDSMFKGEDARIFYTYEGKADSISFAEDVGGRNFDIQKNKAMFLKANWAYDIKVSDKPILNFTNTTDVENAIKGILEVNDKGVKVLDEAKLKGELVDKLVYDATFNSDKEVAKLCRKLIKDAAAAQGATLDSVYPLYVAKAKDKRQYSIPAINLRGMSYNTARSVFSSAIKNKAGAFIFEIARSEIGYTGQRPVELTTSTLAAAIKEGYKLPVFIQGDHFQVTLKDYTGSSEKALEYIKGLIREAIEAGFYQIDLDMSQLVDYTKTNLDEQQSLNYKTTAALTAYIRDLERELGLDKEGIVVNLGGEIGEIGKGMDAGKQQNSTVAELRAFMDGYNAELKRLSKEKGYELKPITKLAIQTGTKHGGVRGANGEVV